MKHAFLKFVSPFFIVMLIGGNAVAAAGSGSIQGQGAVAQAPEAPVDCKKTPDHPRCKDQK